MRCRQFRKLMLDEAWAHSPDVEEHLKTCASCAAEAQQWAKLRSGLRLVAEQPAPEPSLGFARRVARSLQDPSFAGRLADLSLVSVGRRFVYAALTAALLLVLGVLVPASGPVRSPSAAIESTQPETVAAQNYAIFSGRQADTDFEFASPSGSQ
jgi:anti-sigma factor RsiW